MVIALACTAAAGLVATDQWAQWFTHPLVDPALTLNGARLWRIMLAVMAVMLAGLPMVMARLAPAVDVRPSHVPRVLRRKRLAGIAVLMILALGLRAWGGRINESLWYDEIASWMTYNGGAKSAGAVIGSFLDPINHPLHTLLNRWSVAWLADSVGVEMAFRLPALVFSLLTVPIMFALGRAAVNERAGWLAAALAAIAPVCALEGVEARGYAQMIFFSAAATWTFTEAFRRGSIAWWMLYALCCALGVWSQFVTAWIAIGHGAWLVWRIARHRDDRARSAQAIFALLLGAILSLTLYSPMIPGMLAWKAHFLATSPDQPRILGPEGWHAALQLGGSWYWWAAMPGLAAFLIGLRALSRKRPGASARDITPADAIAMALLGLPLMVLTVAVSGSWLYARFMLFAMPGAMLAMAAGIDAMWLWGRQFGIAALSLILIASVADLSLRPPKQPLRDAVGYVAQRAHTGDRVLEVGVAHSVLRIYAPDTLPIASSFFHGERLVAILDPLNPQWVIVEYPLKVPADRYEMLRQRGYRQTAHFRGWADWGNGDVVVFEK